MDADIPREPSAADRFAASAQIALAKHRTRCRATAIRAARATQLDDPQRTLALAALAADLHGNGGPR